MLDFWLPMALIFLAATVTAIVARRRRDRCLKYFNRDPVLILMQTGKWLWGDFMAYPATLELIFKSPQKDENGICKASYVLYGPEIDGIRKILQAVPDKGTPEHERWERETLAIAHPSPLRRFRRWIWNVFNTLRDAVSQSLTVLIGSMKKTTKIGNVAGADKRAGEIGNTLLDTVPSAYEPILEKYLGKKVVVEMLKDKTVVEFTGLLQEYSGKYLLIRNVPFSPDLNLKTSQKLPERFDIIFPRSKALVRHCVVN
ncbi:hypothetical protein [Pontiella agarivorans]|uniref:Uncharacterized protein n=1 Tax=Pontiella agarivorans TaxID=3038953 RepID=A0ABU5MWK8_9BACT|nr:hypothetical protein [Pontiella agarivorans]MDZ8118587.1 hypothetical protein [Pontiella agarivorans]